MLTSDTSASEIIATFDGTDTVYGGGGNDKIIGGKDVDTFYSQAGNDHLYGYSGNDILDGGDGNDRIVGGLGNDNISGGAGDDYVLAQTGNDTISTGTGGDFVLAGLGDDSVVVDGAPNGGSYGADLGPAVFEKTAYTYFESMSGSQYIQLDLSDPDNDPVTRLEIIGGADRDQFWSYSGYGLSLNNRNFEDASDVMVITRRRLIEDIVGLPFFGPDTLDAARVIAPGWDIYALEAEWRGFWVASGRQKLARPDKAFLGWLRGRITR